MSTGRKALPWLQEITMVNHAYEELERFHSNKDNFELQNYLKDCQYEFSAKCHPFSLSSLPGRLSHNLSIPNEIYSCVTYISHSDLHVPPDAAVTALLTCASIALRGAVSVFVREGWVEPSPIMSVMIGDSGARKSGFFSILYKPFECFEKSKAPSERELMMANEIRRISNKHLSCFEGKITRNTVKELVGENPMYIVDKMLESSKELALQSAELREKTAEMCRPAPKVVIDSGTPVALLECVRDNGGCIGVVSPEPSVFRDLVLSPNANLDIILRGYTQEPYTRLGRDQIHLKQPALPMLLASQYSVAAEVYGNKHLNDIGLTPRISPFFLHEHHERVPSMFKSIKLYDAVMIRLLSMYYTQNSSPQRYVINVEADASKLIQDFEEEIKFDIIPDMHGSVTASLKKMHGLAVRFACAFHALLHDIPHEASINAYEMSIGISVARNLINHFQFAHDPRGLPAYPIAKQILDNILSRREDKRHKIGQVWDVENIRSRLGLSAVAATNALKLLEACNWILFHDDGSKNPKFVLHLDAFERYSQER